MRISPCSKPHCFIKFAGFIWLCILPTTLCSEEEPLYVGRFSASDLSGWEEKSFAGETQYRLIQENGRTVLKAETSATASGLFHEKEIDLEKTPFINWSWKIGNIYQDNDEQSKEGDDYPARLYFIVSGGLFFWKTRAANYVWSSNQPAGTTWENAYTGNAKMIAVRSGDEGVGRWHREKRNLREDLKTLFGKEITKIHAVAIMSDSDNTKQRAVAYYGDIFFTGE